MPRDADAFLADIVEAHESVVRMTGGRTFEDFLKSESLVLALERTLEIVGEALKRAEALSPGRTASLPDARPAMGMRDRLAHAYFAIDPLLVWNTATVDLPRLAAAVNQFLGRM